jgi:SpoVK/Ycf46/Vps4 family AAA+-type ATPase
MSISGGTCRLCSSTKPQQETSTFSDNQDQGQQRRRRPRRYRNDDDSSQQEKEQEQEHPPTLQQPTIVMIQYEDDNPDEITRSIREPADDSTVSTTRAALQKSGIILCKWLPTYLSFHTTRLFSKAGDNNNFVEPNPEYGIDDILEFDESVVMFPKDDERVGSSKNGHSSNVPKERSRIDGLLRSCLEDKNEIIEGAQYYGDDTTTTECESWSLGETDPEFVRRPSSGDDRLHGSNNNNNNNNPPPPSRCCYLTIENGNYNRRHKGVAIPLFSPSVTIRPLQSMVISIVGLADDAKRPFRFDSFQNQGGDHDSDNSDDRLSILMQAFWKRQLVGKIVSFEDQWTSRIRLTADINNNNNNNDGLSTEGDGDENTVYAVVESCTPLTITTTRTPAWGNDHKETLPLPHNFYMVLPSTYITILPASSQQSSTQTSVVGLLNNSDKTSSSSKPTNRTSQQSSLLRPPTAAASLLVDTLDCILSRHVGDGDIPRTFLLSGPPGVGKTFSVSWAAKAHPDILLCSIRGSELLQGTANISSSSSGETNIISPARALELEFLKMVEAVSLREEQQKHNNENGNGCAVAGLFFLDECDALVSVEPIAAMLANLLDRVSSTSTTISSSSSEHGETNNVVESYWKRIVVVGATNRIDSIPSYLRRAGRFDRELPMSPPSAEVRAELLLSLLTNLQSHVSSSNEINSETDEEKKPTTTEFKLPSRDEIKEIAELCVGYVAADLSALVRKAWLISLQENIGNDNNSVTFPHLETARNIVGASALRDAALAAPPKITWDDIAGDPGGAKTALRQAIEWPRLKAREFAILGLQPCRGILLHGPPGCAKTTLARAAAGSSGVAFLSLSPAQVYGSSYVGEAERVIRQAFHLARSTAPCILFFDEIDSIFGGGGSGAGNDSGGLGGSGRGSSAEARVLSTFLNEMDGVDIAGAGKDGVLVLGATNRPWTLDPALLRPGRLGDKIIFLPPPDKEARRSIFERQFGNVASVNNNETNDEMCWDLDFSILVELSEQMTGAEIVGACQDAKIQWMRESILNYEPLGGDGKNEDELREQDCIVNALMSIKPLLSNPEALEEFQVFENRDKKTFHR